LHEHEGVTVDDHLPIVPVTDALQVSGDITENAGPNSEAPGENSAQIDSQMKNLCANPVSTNPYADSLSRRSVLDPQPSSSSGAPSSSLSLPATSPPNATRAGDRAHAPEDAPGARVFPARGNAAPDSVSAAFDNNSAGDQDQESSPGTPPASPGSPPVHADNPADQDNDAENHAADNHDDSDGDSPAVSVASNSDSDGDSPPDPTPEPPRPRIRLQGGIRKPRTYTDGTIRYGMFTSTGEPDNLAEALGDDRWRQAMNKEHTTLMQNKT
jgi:hypothetical protein